MLGIVVPIEVGNTQGAQISKRAVPSQSLSAERRRASGGCISREPRLAATGYFAAFFASLYPRGGRQVDAGAIGDQQQVKQDVAHSSARASRDRLRRQRIDLGIRLPLGEFEAIRRPPGLTEAIQVAERVKLGQSRSHREMHTPVCQAPRSSSFIVRSAIGCQAGTINPDGRGGAAASQKALRRRSDDPRTRPAGRRSSLHRLASRCGACSPCRPGTFAL